MKFIDMHCDSLIMLLFRDKENADLYDSKVTSVDFKRMKEGDQLAQFFAVFLPPHEAYKMFGAEDMPDEEYIATLRKYLLDNVAKHKGIIKMAYNADDIERNLSQGLISAFLTMEDGRAVDGKLENVKRFYDMGFRALSLTWNMHNCFGAPNSKDPAIMKEGLTPFGKEAVACICRSSACWSMFPTSLRADSMMLPISARNPLSQHIPTASPFRPISAT